MRPKASPRGDGALPQTPSVGKAPSPRRYAPTSPPKGEVSAALAYTENSVAPMNRSVSAP